MKRPDVAGMALRARETGQIVKREAVIEWITESVGVAKFPALEIGKTIAALCSFNPAERNLSVVALEGPSAALGHVVLALARDAARKGSHVG